MNADFTFFSCRTDPIDVDSLQSLSPAARVATGEPDEGGETFQVEWSQFRAIVSTVPQEVVPRLVEAYHPHFVQLNPDAEPTLNRMLETRQAYSVKMHGAPPGNEVQEWVLGLAKVLDALFLTSQGFFDQQGQALLMFEAQEPAPEPFALTVFSPRPEALTAAELGEAMSGGRTHDPGGGSNAFRVEMPALVDGHDMTFHVHRLPDEHLAAAIPQLRETFLHLAGGDEANMAPRLLDWLASSEQAWVVQTEDVKPGMPGLEPIYQRITQLADKLSGFVFDHGMVLNGSGALLRPVGHPQDGCQDEDWEPSAQQIARRERSLAILTQRQVPIYDEQLYVDDDDEVTLRSPQEVARRVLALFSVALRAEGLSLDRVRSIVRSEDDWSPNEKTFIYDEAPDEAEKQGLIWRNEAVWALLWALGKLDDLPWPSAMADMPRMMNLLRELIKDADFIDQARLRSKEEVLDAQDLTLRINWALRQSYLGQKPLPANLDWSVSGDLLPASAHPGTGVTDQRHLALNWLVGFGNGADWDDVSTPT